VGIVNALGLLKDASAAGPLRDAVKASDADTKRAAAWALANIGDAGSADLLLKAAAAAEGYERTAATDACLLLAENLSAAGRKDEARKIYVHLWESTADETEGHLREASRIGLKSN
jgi:HEAT repeat protein